MGSDFFSFVLIIIRIMTVCAHPKEPQTFSMADSKKRHNLLSINDIKKQIGLKALTS